MGQAGDLCSQKQDEYSSASERLQEVEESAERLCKGRDRGARVSYFFFFFCAFVGAA